MTLLSNIMLADIADVPADLLKHLLTLAIAFGSAWCAFKRSQQGTKDQPVNIAQPLSVQKHDDAAKRSELVRIETTLKSFGDRVDGLAEQIASQFREAQRAGEARVMAITADVNAEMSGVSAKIGEISKLITTALVDNATQGEAINNLKASQHQHQASIAAIHRRIDEIIQQSRKRTNSQS